MKYQCWLHVVLTHIDERPMKKYVNERSIVIYFHRSFVYISVQGSLYICSSIVRILFFIDRSYLKSSSCRFRGFTCVLGYSQSCSRLIDKFDGFSSFSYPYFCEHVHVIEGGFGGATVDFAKLLKYSRNSDGSGGLGEAF